MRLRTFLATCLLAPALLAWGAKGHAITNALALKTLPPEVRAWYAGQEDVVREHASDPDHWKSRDRKEGPRHYLDVEPYGGADGVPYDPKEAIQKVTAWEFQKAGLVPWVIQDRFRDLIDAFKSGDRAKVAYATAILGHYVGDAHVPLHTTGNHDGQQTGQRGVHARWESGLVDRYVDETALKALPASKEPDLFHAPWRWIRSANALLPKLLADDLAADRTSPENAKGTVRRGGYWAIYWDLQRETVQHQLEDGARHLGQLVLYAWELAGKPPAK